jgi:hypothetical protein
MDVLVLIDKLDDTIHNAKPVPLTDQVRVDKEEVYDILDQMRATIPEEIKQARWIVKERQEMLAEAKREAERIIKEAREEQVRLIGEEEIVKQAERQADEIIEDARAREREIRLGAEKKPKSGRAGLGPAAQGAGPVRGSFLSETPSLRSGPRKFAFPRPPAHGRLGLSPHRLKSLWGHGPANSSVSASITVRIDRRGAVDGR